MKRCKRITRRLAALIMAVSVVALAACQQEQADEAYKATFIVDGREQVVEAVDGQVTAPADPVKEGYDFLGWFTAAEGGTKFSGSISADTKYYAQFSEISGGAETNDGYFFNHDWESAEWNGTQAFEDGEGNNLMLQDGKAHTINNSGVIGPCDSWSFSYTPYDLGIGACTIEAKVNCLGTKTEGGVGTFSIRHMYSTNYDVQLVFATETTPSMVGLYNVNNGALIASSTDITNGGQLSGSRIGMNEDHIVKIVYEYNEDPSTTKFYVYVDDVLEIYLPDLPTQSTSAKFGLGASAGTHLEVDYFRCYENEATQAEPTVTKATLVKGWDFNETEVLPGSTLEGMDSYTEGKSLYTNGLGQLQSVSSTDNGEIVFGATSWSSIRTAYDMNIPANYVLQAKVCGISAEGAEGETTALAALRPSHAQWGDIHIQMSSVPGNGGIHFYKGGGGWFSQGGLTILMDQTHTIEIYYQQTAEGAGDGDWGVYTISVYVDGELVLRNKEGESFGPDMSVGLFAGDGNILFDSFRIYGIE